MSSRKRPAPGASPVQQAQQHQLNQQPSELSSKNEASQLAPDQYLQWHQQNLPNSANSYSDPAGDLGLNLFNALYQAPAVPSPTSNQLARRPTTHHLVPRTIYGDTGDDAWPLISEDGMQPPQDQAWLNSNDELEQKAQIARRDTQAKRKQIPPFVQKLSSFLDESRNTELIRWSESGDSFIVVDEDEFAKTLIPELFKHNNYASFVRQLNMYGFHKKVGLSDNSMRASERKNKSPSEYYNPYFKRGRPNLLWLVQKPKNPQGKGGGKGGVRIKQEEGIIDDDGEDTLEGDFSTNMNPIFPEQLRNGRQPLMIGQGGGQPPQEDLANVHRELQAVLHQQKLISSMLSRTREDYLKLFRQATVFQNLHEKHETSINAILSFLATVYNRSLEGEGTNLANMFAGAIPPDSQGQGNVVDVEDYGEKASENKIGQPPRSFRKQPLLLKAPPANPQISDSRTPSSQLPPPPNPQWEQIGRVTAASPGSSNDVNSPLPPSPLPRPESRLSTSSVPAINNSQAYAGPDIMSELDQYFNSEFYSENHGLGGGAATGGANIDGSGEINLGNGDDLGGFNFDLSVAPDGGGVVDGAFRNGFDLPVREDGNFITNSGIDGQAAPKIEPRDSSEPISPSEAIDDGSGWLEDGRSSGKRRRI